MFKTSSRILLFGLVVVLIFSIGLSVIAQDKCEDPDVLTYAAMSQERAPVLAKRLEPLFKYIEEVTGKKVEFYMTTSYAAQGEALKGGYADIANMSPTTYTLVNEDKPGTVRVFATYAQKPIPQHFIEGGPAYQGIVVVKKGGEYDTETPIEDLKGATAGFPDPGSTSGWIVPNALFAPKVLGESLDSYFGEVTFTGSHDANILAVLEGRIDVAFTWDAAPYRLWKRGEIGKPEEELRVIWRSPDIPLDPYSYRSDLCPSVKEDIKKAFLTWDEQPESDEFFKAIGSEKIVEMEHEDYDVIKDLIEKKRELS